MAGAETLEAMKRFTDNPVKIKKVIDKWLLLTYDLPHTPEGDKARAEFLARANAIGATRHTDSVYLMPWSPAAEKIALDLAKTEGSDVIVWSQAQPLDRADEITNNYDNALKPKLREISERLDRMSQYMIKNQQGRMLQMVKKTQRLLQEAEATIKRREGHQYLQMWVEILKTRAAQMGI